MWLLKPFGSPCLGASGGFPGPFGDKMKGAQNHRNQYQKIAFLIAGLANPGLFLGSFLKPFDGFSSLLAALGGFCGFPDPFGKMEACPKPSISVLKNSIFNCGSGKSWVSGFSGAF